MPSPLPAATAFGRRLRVARLAKDWTQAQLGERLFGVDDPNTAAPRISRYERGMSKPNLKTIEQLAKLLDLPVAYFIATPDVVAEAILVMSKLSPAKQKQALAVLKDLQSVEARPQKRTKGVS